MRWLRPEFQAPTETRRAVQQAALDVEPSAALPVWPKQPPDQYVALRATLSRGQAGPSELARQFRGVRPAKLAGMLEVLAGLGQARKMGPGRWVA